MATQEPSDELDNDSNTDSLPKIFNKDIKGSIVEENTHEKCNMVEKLNMKNKEKALETSHDVVGQIFVANSNCCFSHKLKYIYAMQKISSKIEESEARWPTRVYFGKEGQMNSPIQEEQNRASR